MKELSAFFIAIFFSSGFTNESQSVLGTLISAVESGKRINLEVSVQNNLDTTIYLDSNLFPYSYQIIKRIDYIDEDGMPDVRSKVYAGEGHAKDQSIFLTRNWMVEIKSGQNHLFKISRRHNFDLQDGTARIQFKFNYYVKKGMLIKSIAVSKDLKFLKN
jgi:hypothetical protein